MKTMLLIFYQHRYSIATNQSITYSVHSSSVPVSQEKFSNTSQESLRIDTISKTINNHLEAGTSAGNFFHEPKKISTRIMDSGNSKHITNNRK